jgi:hypothetical protein
MGYGLPGCTGKSKSELTTSELLEKAILQVFRTERSTVVDNLPCTTFKSTSIRFMFGKVFITLSPR